MAKEAKKKTETKAKKTNPKGPKVTITAELLLTDHARAKCGLEAAQLQREYDELERRKKKEAAELQAQIKDRHVRIRTLLQQVETGKETREIEATEVKNFETKKVFYYYKGDLVHTRDLQDADRQEALPLKEGKKGKETKTETKAESKAPAVVKMDEKTKAITEDKACAATPGKKPPRGKWQEKPMNDDIQSVMRSETNRKTKTSAVDGARAA